MGNGKYLPPSAGEERVFVSTLTCCQLNMRRKSFKRFTCRYFFTCKIMYTPRVVERERENLVNFTHHLSVRSWLFCQIKAMQKSPSEIDEVRNHVAGSWVSSCSFISILGRWLNLASMFGLKYGLKVTTRWSMWHKTIEIIGFFEPQWTNPEMCFNKKEQLPTTRWSWKVFEKILTTFHSSSSPSERTFGHGQQLGGQSFWKFVQGFLTKDWSTCWNLGHDQQNALCTLCLIRRSLKVSIWMI